MNSEMHYVGNCLLHLEESYNNSTMKHVLFLVVILFISINGYAQQEQELQSYNERMKEISRNGMISLGSWAVANIGVGTVGYFTTSGELKYFHGMNALWNLTNLGIAIPGYLGSRPSKDDIPSLYELTQSQKTTETTYMVNAGIDVGYIMGGLYMNELAKNVDQYNNLLSGFGKAIIVQGGYLLIFDGIMYAIHSNHASSQMPELFKHVSISPKGMGMSIRVSFN